MNRAGLDEVIERAGGRKAFAKAMGVSMSAVEKWAIGEREPRPAKVLQMEAMWGIPRERLMPSLFRVGPIGPRTKKQNTRQSPIDTRDQM
jgi:DNA-binding transcriptional regulator YdaS (Cro superfamily)